MFKLTVAIALLVYCQCEEKPLVQTPLGAVSGFYETSQNGRIFSSFEGIPYAKPPIGKRRFEGPEPVEPWEGVWNASFSTVCAQAVFTRPNETTGDEDCLHINVYVPGQQIPSEKLDVLVHIHGGGFMYMDGKLYAKPYLLMDKDIVFVTFNYRLGILGFLSTEDGTVPGNNGLKDQVEALKWIQKNIASFGGNPKSVTLTGLSAGGASVHYHLLSHQSKNLFHRAFSQSGTALNPWALQDKPLRNAKKLAAALGCPTEQSELLVECLKQRPVKQLLDKLQDFLEFSVFPVAPFAPVVEKGGENNFINENPFVLLKQGKVNDVPWLVSMTSQEGFFLVSFLDNLDYIDQNWNKLAPFLLDYNDTAPQDNHKIIAEKIKQHYLDNKKISKETVHQLAEIFTDRLFYSDAEFAYRMQAKVATSPVYGYCFNYPGDNNPTKIIPHAADAKYFFTNVLFSTGNKLTENELKMSKLLIDMLTNFAKSGVPTIPGADFPQMEFDKLTVHLIINGFEKEDIKPYTHPQKEFTPTLKFWKSLNFSEGLNSVANDEDS